MRLHVRSWGTSRADITSFSGRSVKLRRQVEGQHPHNATAEYNRPPHHCLIHNHFSLSSSAAPCRPYARHVPHPLPSARQPRASRRNIRGNSNNADKAESSSTVPRERTRPIGIKFYSAVGHSVDFLSHRSPIFKRNSLAPGYPGVERINLKENQLRGRGKPE